MRQNPKERSIQGVGSQDAMCGVWLVRNVLMETSRLARETKQQDAIRENETKIRSQRNRTRYKLQDQTMPGLRTVVPERMGGRARLSQVQVDRILARGLIPSMTANLCAAIR